MSRYSFKIIDFDFVLQDTIEDFANPFFSHKFYGTGEFQLDVNNLNHAAALKAGNIIFENADEPFIIESVEINIDKNKMLAKGRQLKSIFDRRITYPPTGESYDSITGDVETIMKTLIDHNFVTTDEGRVVSNITIATNQNRGTSTTFQTTRKNLLEALEKLAAIGDIGFDLTLDLVNSKFVFDVIVGLDRTYDQSTNSNPLWCRAMNTVVSQSYSEDSKNYKNFVVVGGKGEGLERAIVEVEASALNTGWNRRETFIEATDIEEGEDETTVLEERGKTCLSQFVNAYELDSVAANTLTYGTDYNLGDLVTVYESQISLQQDTRIVEVTKNYSQDGLQIHPVFGSNKPSATSVLQSATGTGIEIPTSYIIEEGSNENGSYKQYSNGEMICEYIGTVTDQAINTAYNGVYIGGRTWTFPASFYSEPIVHLGMIRWGTSLSRGFYITADNSSASLRVIDQVTRATGTATYIRVMARGRWKE